MAASAEVRAPPAVLLAGPEKTLTLCFKQAKVAQKSLRLIPQDTWASVLKAFVCDAPVSVVESGPAVSSRPKKGNSRVTTRSVTSYLFAESSLVLADTTLSLKTRGQTSPLAVLGQLLDLIVESWRNRYPGDFLRYASYMRVENASETGKSCCDEWPREVEHLNGLFEGDAVVLGSEATSKYHVYVANYLSADGATTYLSRDTVASMFSTQVTLTSLDAEQGEVRFSSEGTSCGDGAGPLRAAWKQLHGDEPRSIAAQAQFDGRFLDRGAGFVASAVFGDHATRAHAAPEATVPQLSVETSAPLTQGARQRFVAGASNMCGAASLTVVDFALSPKIFSGALAPEIPEYDLQLTAQTVGKTFACAFHHYVRRQLTVRKPEPPSSPSLAPAVPPATSPVLPCLAAESEEVAPNEARRRGLASATKRKEGEAKQQERKEVVLPRIVASDAEEAALRAAMKFLADDASAGRGGEKDVPMVLLDIGAVKRMADVWHRLLPRVEPFYAVKCNPHPALVAALWSIWQQRGKGGFDCASPAEMHVALGLGGGFDAGRHIVYANPCKQGSAVSFAKKVGVKRLVFDNTAELDKLNALYPEAELVLRVQTDDSLAQCPLSNKFGAPVEECESLLSRAKELGMSVVGVSFHVGSGCSQVGAFRSALGRAKIVFDQAERQGFAPTLLDIGGGFPGWDEEGKVTFADHAADICAMLEEHFASPAIQVIAEPGRFFAATSQSLLATVVSVAEAASGYRYYLNDGLYGSFNCLLYDHAHVQQPKILRGGIELLGEQAGPTFPCTVFGPTCDGFDVVSEALRLPRLKVGDGLVFPKMGAYTSAASTTFNGFAPAAAFVYESTIAA